MSGAGLVKIWRESVGEERDGVGMTVGAVLKIDVDAEKAKLEEEEEEEKRKG